MVVRIGPHVNHRHHYYLLLEHSKTFALSRIKFSKIKPAIKVLAPSVAILRINELDDIRSLLDYSDFINTWQVDCFMESILFAFILFLSLSFVIVVHTSS